MLLSYPAVLSIVLYTISGGVPQIDIGLLITESMSSLVPSAQKLGPTSSDADLIGVQQ